KHIDAALQAVNKSLWTSTTGPDGQPGWKHEITKDIVYQKELPGPPRRFMIDVRGQVFAMRQMFGALAGGRVFEGLTGGLIMAVVVILLLLTAYFQSARLAIIVVSTAPAVLDGLIFTLLVI